MLVWTEKKHQKIWLKK
ncbi:hypothetical protein A3Q56_07991 [Intoshia linei]|uniref:Uncharacterized protein n=1 Tax=Intoshia linei TaxID=1819745 RepID=A0A177AQM9_9BILA|nr:hypothetical protein A3Q56_07991 [Intoshia linei]